MDYYLEIEVKKFISCPKWCLNILTSQTCQYIILKAIGEGQFGVVSCCKIKGTDEKVAVKIIKDSNDAVMEEVMI